MRTMRRVTYFLHGTAHVDITLACRVTRTAYYYYYYYAAAAVAVLPAERSTRR